MLIYLFYVFNCFHHDYNPKKDEGRKNTFEQDTKTRGEGAGHIAYVAGAWTKARTGARQGDSRVGSFSPARFFLCPLLPSACYAGYGLCNFRKGTLKL